MNEKTSYQKGIEAEKLAYDFLIKNNFEIIGTRIKNKAGEIDILAKLSADYYIFEVKNRKTIDEGKEAITIKQINRSINAFFLYAQDKNIEFENIFLKAIIITKTKMRLVNIDSIEDV
jgi:putative endonuclease